MDDIPLPFTLQSMPRIALEDATPDQLAEELAYWQARLAAAEALDPPQPVLVRIQRDFLADVEREIARR
jgi:hypothetical protein